MKSWIISALRRVGAFGSVPTVTCAALTAALPFAEAIDANAVRTLLPTELRSKDLADLDPALLQRARFSAGVVRADFLQAMDDEIAGLTEGTAGRAESRERLKAVLGSLGDDSIDNTDLTDLRSDARLNLILDTNLAQAQGYGRAVQAMQAEVLDEWPAWELVRVRDSEEERDWAARWREAGGEFYGDRMIALKTDPIWSRISRFGTPYPPFDFNSGMDVQDIDRAEAEDIGLLAPDEVVQPGELPDFNAELEASPDVRADWLRKGLGDALEGVAKFAADGVLKFVGGAA